MIDQRPPNWCWNALLATPPLRALAATVFFHHRGLRSAAAWRDVVCCLLTGRTPHTA
jgi:hypothetical protein